MESGEGPFSEEVMIFTLWSEVPFVTRLLGLLFGCVAAVR